MGLLLLIPETPRYLVGNEKYDETKIVIARIFPNATESQVEQKIELMRYGTLLDRSMNAELTLKKRLKLLYFDRANLRALIVACGLMGISSLRDTMR